MHELPKHYDHRAAQARCRTLWDARRDWHAEPVRAAARFRSSFRPPT